MKHLTVLVDLDGIAVDTTPHWLFRIFEKTGVMAVPNDIRRWDLSQCPPLDKVPRELIFGVLDEPGFTLKLPPMPGVSSELKRLHDAGHKVYFITARYGANAMPETLAWLRIHIPWAVPEKQLGFFSDKHIIRGDVLIDDKPATLSNYRLINPAAELITIDYPYNQNAPDDVFRVEYGDQAWTTIRERIESLARVVNDSLH